ncbi:MAG: RNase P subunit p30 family protein [Thermoproteota archaeon]|nr:RNase P subunit p30 family protein [Thermoproteota archaeon]
MRKFVDLHLRPPLNDFAQVKKMFAKSHELGYSMVGVSLPPNIPKKGIYRLQELSNSTDIDLVTRVNLVAENRRELLNRLRQFRRKFEIVSVVCTLKKVAREAAKDRRVDLLSFPPVHLRRCFFDHAEAELASKVFASLEIEMAPLLELEGLRRIQLLSRLRREVKIAVKFNVPIVLSSGAKNVYFMRSPHDYAALTSLFDMTQPLALCSFSETPLSLVKRNREKLSPSYVAPGVRVVRRGKNCLSV